MSDILRRRCELARVADREEVPFNVGAIASLIDRAETAERELAVLRNRPCPYVHSSREGTHYCTLPHAAEKELAELRKRIDEAPRGMVRGFMLEPETQPGWLDKMGGKRVAILPLREGE